jgi:hypothetical protein
MNLIEKKRKENFLVQTRKRYANLPKKQKTLIQKI